MITDQQPARLSGKAIYGGSIEANCGSEYLAKVREPSGRQAVSPLLRFVLVAFCVGIASLTGFLGFRAIAQNIIAAASWRRTEGLVSGGASEDGWLWTKNEAAIRVYLSTDLEAMRQAESVARDGNYPQYQTAAVDGFRTVPITTNLAVPNDNDTLTLFVDPADDHRVKSAGFLQM